MCHGVAMNEITQLLTIIDVAALTLSYRAHKVLAASRAGVPTVDELDDLRTIAAEAAWVSARLACWLQRN